MARKTPITFLDRRFCFTGKFAEMLRKDAEQEVRARGGMTQPGVTATLDYLVIGDIPSPSWAFGDYGTKIQKALDLKAEGRRKPRIVSEGEFFENLLRTPPNNSGAIDSKIISCTYRVSVDSAEVMDSLDFGELANRLSSLDACHVKVKVYPMAAFGLLFAEESVVSVADGWDVEVRVAKVAGLDYPAEALVSGVRTVLSEWFGETGDLSIVERNEGSISFGNYLKELPKAERVQYLTTDR
jgi:hypothetical protein